MPQTTNVEEKPNTPFLEVQVINLAEISRSADLRVWAGLVVARPLPLSAVK